MELLQYLDMEESWLNAVEEKVTASDNLPESAEAVAEALEVRRGTGARALDSRVLTKHRAALADKLPLDKNVE